MNALFPTPQSRERHKFTIDDVLDMTAREVIPKRAVLLDGEVYDMPSDGPRHTRLTMILAQHLMVALHGQPYFVGVQTTLRLAVDNGPSPDMYVLAGGLPDGDVPPEKILLVIEVADTSLKDDLTDSASRYARHGVRDYWVVDVNARAILVHRDLAQGAYAAPRLFEATERVATLLVPNLDVSLADLPGLD